MSDVRVLRPFEPPTPAGVARAVPLAMVMLGSAMTILPFVATFPILPPFGLLMLLAWRLRRPDAFRTWEPVLLGLFDDLVSGQPLGSAMLFWTLATLAVAVIETRLVWRNFAQDWLVAAAGVAACLLGGRLVATPLASHADSALLLQVVAGAALFPLAARLVAQADRRIGR